MTDILGNALQRLTTAVPVSLPERELPSADLAEGTLLASGASAPTEQASVAPTVPPLELTPTAATPPEPTPAAVSKKSVVFPLSRIRAPALTARLSAVIPFVLTHRRQGAAVIVLACMALIWFDGNASPPAGTDEQELIDVDAMLSEFDAPAAEHLREPAEPVESTYGNGTLTIPSTEQSDDSHPSAFPGTQETPNSVAAYPDADNVDQTHPQQRSPDSTPASRKPVRFTGRIQPLN